MIVSRKEESPLQLAHQDVCPGMLSGYKIYY